MKKKLQQLRDSNIDELSKRVAELRKELVALAETEKVKTKKIKKQVARALTIIKERGQKLIEVKVEAPKTEKKAEAKTEKKPQVPKKPKTNEGASAPKKEEGEA